MNHGFIDENSSHMLFTVCDTVVCSHVDFDHFRMKARMRPGISGL